MSKRKQYQMCGSRESDSINR